MTEAVSLGEIAEVNPERFSSPREARVRYVDISSVRPGVGLDVSEVQVVRFGSAPSRAQRAIRAGDTLVSTVRPYLRATAQVNRALDGAVASTGFAVVRARPRRADPDFIYAFCRSDEFVGHLITRQTGSNYPAVRPTDVADAPLRVPPLDQQRRMAREVGAADALVATASAELANLEMIREGLERGCVPTEEGDLPWGWRFAGLGDEFDLQLGKMLDPRFKSGGRWSAPYLANRHVQWRDADLSDLDSMDFRPAERARLTLKPGDLLVCEGGEVGRTALWRDEVAECYFQKAIHRLRTRGSVGPRFMLAVMRVYAIDGRPLKDLVSETSIAHLTQEKLRRLRIPVPTAADLARIEASLEEIDSAVSAATEYVRRVEGIRTGLLRAIGTVA